MPSQSNGPHPPYSSGDQRRGTRFRRRHTPGDLVAGRVVRNAGEGMAWVDFEGEALLTNMSPCPAPGTMLTFEVLRTHPEIQLREARGAANTASGLSRQIHDFFAARSAFEARLAQGDHTTGTDQASFLQALPPGATELYARVNDCVRNINDIIREQRSDRLSYPPWLAPHARELELLCTPPDAAWGHAVLGLRTARFGAVQIRAVLRSPQLRCRVYAEHPQGAERLVPLLVVALPRSETSWEVESGRAERLPKRHRGGLPAELLAPIPPHFSL